MTLDPDHGSFVLGFKIGEIGTLSFSHFAGSFRNGTQFSGVFGQFLIAFGGLLGFQLFADVVGIGGAGFAECQLVAGRGRQVIAVARF